mmetsp:Transcript_6940/g.22857  ORF Transcript_6940/g.22857 Transcript_6940/m.22857 type:complete len:266 (+) Transcript_6940:699-1496(+)
MLCDFRLWYCSIKKALLSSSVMFQSSSATRTRDEEKRVKQCFHSLLLVLLYLFRLQLGGNEFYHGRIGKRLVALHFLRRKRRDAVVAIFQNEKRALDVRDGDAILFVQNRVGVQQTVVAALDQTKRGALFLQRAGGERHGGETLGDFRENRARRRHLQLVILFNGALVNLGLSLILLLGLTFATGQHDIQRIGFVQFNRLRINLVFRRSLVQNNLVTIDDETLHVVRHHAFNDIHAEILRHSLDNLPNVGRTRTRAKLTDDNLRR